MPYRTLLLLSLTAVVLAAVSAVAFGLNFLDVAEDALEEDTGQGGPRQTENGLFLPLWSSLPVSAAGLLSALAFGLIADKTAPPDAPPLEASASPDTSEDSSPASPAEPSGARQGEIAPNKVSRWRR